MRTHQPLAGYLNLEHGVRVCCPADTLTGLPRHRPNARGGRIGSRAGAWRLLADGLLPHKPRIPPTRARAHSHCHHLLLDYALWYGSLLTMAVVLAQQGDTMKCGGGVFTPAACQGQLLRQRLESTGSSFQWLDE